MKPSAKTGSALAGAALVAMLPLLFLASCSDRDLAPEWRDYVERYFRDGRIVDTGNDGVSHSEGQGYGMLLAVHFGDRERFDALWRWTRDTLARPDGLFSWRYRPCPAADDSCIDDPNNASDGDLLIAWALLRAADRFGDDGHREAARRIGAAVREHLIVDAHGYRLLLPGREGFVDNANADARSYRLNLSYWIFPALERFHRSWGDDDSWRALAEDGRRLLQVARFGERRLHPDWLVLGPDGPRLAADDTRYGYNACRIPLHLVWSDNTASVRELLGPYAAFWRGAQPPPAWVELDSGAVAAYAWSDGMAAIAEATLALEPTLAGPAARRLASGADNGSTRTESYYSDSLQLLAAMALKERG